MKTPVFYRAPLRKREDIVDYLVSDCRHYTSYLNFDGRCFFAFKVKLNAGIDLEFETIIRVAQRQGFLPQALDEEWREEAEEEYHSETVYDAAIAAAKWQVIHQDYSLFNGDPVKVKMGFVGRSEGYIALLEFEGYDFTRTDMDKDDWRRVFSEDMTYEQLRQLYRFIVQCKHDFSYPQVVEEIQVDAAFQFVYNIMKVPI